MPTNYGTATEKKISEVMYACERYGEDSIIALSGVPGTGKSFLAAIAAQRLASDPEMVREVQFHPTYSYEEFIEGYRANAAGGFSVERGAFLEWNDLASEDSEHKYVLLIEELTRANMPSVLGELMTYVEHRDRNFVAPYSHRPIRMAKNLVLIATFNPRDRSALDMDDALIRRLRIIQFLPDTNQLTEMLGTTMGSPVVDSLKAIFEGCRAAHASDFGSLMPFGHGIFSGLRGQAPDLYLLWHQRILPLLRPPARQPHPFAETIERLYPWKVSQDYVLPPSASGGSGS